MGMDMGTVMSAEGVRFPAGYERHRGGCNMSSSVRCLLVAGMAMGSLSLPVAAQSVSAPDGVGASTATGDVGPAAAPKQGWRVTSGISVSETFTNNGNVSSQNRRSDQITEVTPGIAVSGESGRLKGRFDYQLHELIHAQEAQRNETQQSLNANGTLEAVEKWLFLEASGLITQQSISAFGTQSANNSSANANRTETSAYQVSPYTRGKFGSFADYELRYRRSTSRSKSDLAADVDSEDWLLNLNGAVSQANLTWLIESTWQSTEFRGQRATDADRLRAYLSYQPDMQLKLSLIGGSESNNYLTTDKKRKTTTGYGFEWAPSERTKLAGQKESRFFGEGHSLSFTHRMPLTAISYVDTRDVTALPNQLGFANRGNLYDVLDQSLLSSIPDPVARDLAVRKMLQDNGWPPNAIVINPFLASQVSVERLQTLSMVMSGVRNVITLALTQSQRQALTSTVGLGDDFAISSTVKQRGFNANWSYRVSGYSALNLTLSQQNAISPTRSDLDTRQRNLNLGLTTRFGNKTTGSLTLRRALFDSATNPYTENALIAAVSIQF